MPTIQPTIQHTIQHTQTSYSDRHAADGLRTEFYSIKCQTGETTPTSVRHNVVCTDSQAVDAIYDRNWHITHTTHIPLHNIVQPSHILYCTHIDTYNTTQYIHTASQNSCTHRQKLAYLTCENAKLQAQHPSHTVHVTYTFLPNNVHSTHACAHTNLHSP